jgi:hypothetical protein
MPDVNYSLVGSAYVPPSNDSGVVVWQRTNSTGSSNIIVGVPGTYGSSPYSAADSFIISISVFR